MLDKLKDNMGILQSCKGYISTSDVGLAYCLTVKTLRGFFLCFVIQNCP